MPGASGCGAASRCVLFKMRCDLGRHASRRGAQVQVGSQQRVKAKDEAKGLRCPLTLEGVVRQQQHLQHRRVPVRGQRPKQLVDAQAQQVQHPAVCACKRGAPSQRWPMLGVLYCAGCGHTLQESWQYAGKWGMDKERSLSGRAAVQDAILITAHLDLVALAGTQPVNELLPSRSSRSDPTCEGLIKQHVAGEERAARAGAAVGTWPHHRQCAGPAGL